MLVVECGTQDWSSPGASKFSSSNHSATNGLTETPPSAVLRNSHSVPAATLVGTDSRMSCNPGVTEESVDAYSTMSMPPFLQPLAKAHCTDRGRPYPACASAKMPEAAPKQQATTSRSGDGGLPSAPSTASTATAENTTNVADAPFREPSGEKVEASSVALPFEKTQLNPVQGERGTTTKKPIQVASSPDSLSCPYKPMDIGAPVADMENGLQGKKCSKMQQFTHSTEDHTAQKCTLPLMQTGRRSAAEDLEVTKCKGIPCGSSVACLVAALGASSIRLAAAAEEGLDSSPSDADSRVRQGSEIYPIRTSGSAPTEFSQAASPSATNSLTFTRGSPIIRRVLPASKVTATTRNRRKFPSSLDGRRISKFQGSPLRVLSQETSTKEVLTAGRRSDTTGQKQIASSHYELDPILLDLRANGSNNGQTVSMVSQESETPPCRNTCSPPAVESTRSSGSDRKTCVQEIPAKPSVKATVLPSSVQNRFPWENVRRSPQLPLLAHGPDSAETKRQDCASDAYHGEEEHQFSLLIQHSLGLLRREAARCFASSQASVKQKLWRELQHERHLRLQLQHEYQVEAAAAEAELASLRAQKVEDHERLEKILGICCRRKHTDENTQLMRLAWKGWQLQRVLTGRLKKLQQALQQRCLFMLQLRVFLPWRTAAARRTLAQELQRTQRLFQQEMERLGQTHLENSQRQQQEIRQLQQQVDSEVHLRECLKHSLVGLVTGKGIGASQQGVHTPRACDTTSFTAVPASGTLNARRQQRPKAPENRTRWQQVLRVVGTQSNLRSRRNPTSQSNPKQQPDEQLQQPSYAPNQSRWHWVLENADLGVPPPLLRTLFKFDSRGASELSGHSARRVKFTDEQMQQQQQNEQQKLLLLANLLSESFSQRQNCNLCAAAGGPKCFQSCRHQQRSSSAWASASAPAFGCWELSPDTSFKKNAASVGRHSPGDYSLLQPAYLQANATLGGDRNFFANGLRNPSSADSLGLECQLHKQTRWTSAEQSTPAV
ncbi:hypothetical protein, conserved [Eimeria brunetti]|uniref:Uncharacterized protein n=1 Tax=Eimeria brunetti TaxID=51314 RepID=U6LJ16_9EIME|nr:hypothetical protein, conserved [Eimeria brunetti]